MEHKDPDHVDSILKVLTGFNSKEFLIIFVAAYMSVLTTPAVIEMIGLASNPIIVVVAVMIIQYYLLYYVGKMHGSSILKTMTSKSFIGWLMWLALVCMLLLPVIHLLSIFGLT